MIKFGTAGIPLSAKTGTTEAGIVRLKELGLEAMEVEFVRGVQMKEDKAGQVRAVAERENIALTCHAPYYINLNSPEQEKVIASRSRLIQTARVAKLLGATSIVFHAAFYSGESKSEVLKKVINELVKVREELAKEGNHVILRPETTGKPSQFGNLAEIIIISQEVPGVLPCIDFSHLHARENGAVNSYEEFCAILEQTAEGLAGRWTENAHFHISGIEYGQKGEKKHLVLKEADLKYEDLIKALINSGIKGTVICESPNLEEDAILLQKTYIDFLGSS